MPDEKLSQEESQLNDELVKLLEEHAEELSCRFDTVQIICTRKTKDEDVITELYVGKGNIYARIGSTQSWLNQTINGK